MSSTSATRKSRWTDTLYHPINVLEHAETLHLEKFTHDELDDLAGCTDIWRLDLSRDRADAPLDLARLAHITGLQALWLERVQIKNLSALTTLPRLRHLILQDCKLAPLDEPTGVYVKWPQELEIEYTAQSPRQWVEESLARHASRALDPSVATKLVSTGTVSISDYECDDPREQRQVLWQGLVLAGAPDTRDVPDESARQLSQHITDGDWSRVYVVADLPLWSKALNILFDNRLTEESVRGVLAHPTPGFFDEAVICGLASRYTQDIKLVVQVFSEQGERLLAPLQAAFRRFLKSWGHNDFDVDKPHVAHFTIAAILAQINDPAFTPLCQQFLDERHNFSQIHLRLYKALLDSVGKTQSALLVEPIVDLLRFEQRVIGGDSAFVKKILKAVGQLGRSTDAALLVSQFDIAAEARPDVIAAYETTLLRLRKKKS